MLLQQSALAVAQGQSRALLDQVIVEAVGASFGELWRVNFAVWSGGSKMKACGAGYSPSPRKICRCAGIDCSHLRALGRARNTQG